MQQPPTAGAHIRMTIEGIVRDAYQPGIFTLSDGTHVSYTPGQHDVTVLAPGWEVGDMIDTEHGVLTRVVDDGYAFWRCTEFEPPRDFHDDQVRPADLRVIRRATPAPEQPAAPAVDDAARLRAVEDLVTRADGKGVSRIDTYLLVEALGLTKAAVQEPDAEADGVGPHNFEAEHLGEVEAKRRLPKCRVCREDARAPLHDGDQSEETRHLRMLLNA